MADTKVSALTADTSPTVDDLLYIVDDPGGTPASRKVTVANLFSAPFNIYADAANILAQRNGTSAQESRLYNTYTDASNNEYAKMRWNSNVLEIGPVANGTGTTREMQIIGPAHTIDFNALANNGMNFLAETDIVAQIRRSNGSDAQLRLTTSKYGLTFGGSGSGGAAAGLNYADTSIVKFTNGQGGAGAMQLDEMTAPAGLANAGRIFTEDNGSGKTRLMVQFGTGAAQQIAIEP